MHRLSGPQISPDGKWIAYEVATPDLAANRTAHNIWIAPAGGGEARQLTRGGNDMRPRWSPNGRKLAFLSARNGATQVYWVAPEGGDANRLTSLSSGADNELWSPDGKSIAFTSSVYPDCKDDACNAARDDEESKSKVKAHVYEKLLFRHWNAWSDGKRSHLFIVAADGGAPRDLTPGADYDVPPFSLGEPDAIAFSPDSQELCFTANTDKDEALSTNGDLFTVAASGASAPKRITTNPANDWGGVYSPNGKWIAYRSQFQAGYESDRWRLMLYDRATGKTENLTQTFDRAVGAFAWMPDGKAILFEAENHAEMPIYSIAVAPGNSAKAPKAIITGGPRGRLRYQQRREHHRIRALHAVASIRNLRCQRGRHKRPPGDAPECRSPRANRAASGRAFLVRGRGKDAGGRVAASPGALRCRRKNIPCCW